MIKNTITAAFLAALFCSQAFADSAPVFYVNGGVGEVDFDEDGFDDPTGFEIIGGYKVNQNFAFEVSYVDFGESEEDEWEMEISADTLTLGVLGIVPLTDNFNLFAKLGWHFWDAELKEEGFGKLLDDDGNDLFYGVGAEYVFEQGFGIGVRYNNYEVDGGGFDGEAKMISAHLSYYF